MNIQTLYAFISCLLLDINMAATSLNYMHPCHLIKILPKKSLLSRASYHSLPAIAEPPYWYTAFKRAVTTWMASFSIGALTLYLRSYYY